MNTMHGGTSTSSPSDPTDSSPSHRAVYLSYGLRSKKFMIQISDVHVICSGSDTHEPVTADEQAIIKSAVNGIVDKYRNSHGLRQPEWQATRAVTLSYDKVSDRDRIADEICEAITAATTNGLRAYLRVGASCERRCCRAVAQA